MDEKREKAASDIERLFAGLDRNTKQQEEISRQGPVRLRQAQEQQLMQQQQQLQGMRLGCVGGRPQAGLGSMAQVIADKSRIGYSSARSQSDQLYAQVG